MSKKHSSFTFRGVTVRGPIHAGYQRILSADFLEFIGALHRNFEKTRQTLLAARQERQKEFDQGKLPSFLPETKWIRDSDWKGPSIPKDLEDRRVEITGPTDRKMVINALNSGANVFMADFEDSLTPTWDNLITGAINLIDAVNHTISLKDKGKEYKLKKHGLATLLVRPRGWHLDEEHILVDGAVMSGSLFDFALYFYHNAHETVRRGSAPYFYLPKMESHKEARLWNDVFVFSQAHVGIPRGTIRATVLIETLLGAFEMDEIIYELREHSSGLNCGRWDYIFGFVKVFRNQKQFLLPDRSQVTMTVPFMAAYVRNLVHVCHRRGVHAMGGMAAQIPIKGDEKANKIAMDKVINDKLREVKAGHDGTWVAHPGLVDLAANIFDQYMKNPHQIDFQGDPRPVTDKEMLELPTGTSVTLAGIRNNISAGLRYVEAWLRGIGCVPIDHLMEDAATAEIARVQLWSWIKHKGTADGKTITLELVNGILDEELKSASEGLGKEAYKKRKFEEAGNLLRDLLAAKELPDFLTHNAYKQVIKSTLLPLPAKL